MAFTLGHAPGCRTFYLLNSLIRHRRRSSDGGSENRDTLNHRLDRSITSEHHKRPRALQGRRELPKILLLDHNIPVRVLPQRGYGAPEPGFRIDSIERSDPLGNRDHHNMTSAFAPRLEFNAQLVPSVGWHICRSLKVPMVWNEPVVALPPLLGVIHPATVEIAVIAVEVIQPSSLTLLDDLSCASHDAVDNRQPSLLSRSEPRLDRCRLAISAESCGQQCRHLLIEAVLCAVDVGRGKDHLRT